MFQYSFSQTQARASRSLGKDKESLYTLINEVLLRCEFHKSDQNDKSVLLRSGLPVQKCLLRAVCELAEAEDIAGQNLSKALQAFLLLEGDIDSLEVINARMVGETSDTQGQCGQDYSICPVNLVNLNMTDLIGFHVPELLSNLII